MAIGTNDTIVKVGATPFVVEAGAAAIANNTIQALANAYVPATSGQSAPDVSAALSVTFATAPTANTTLDLYAQALAIDGTATHDEQAPTTAYKPRYIGSFVVNAVTTLQYISKTFKNVPLNAKYYIHNNGTGQTTSAGLTLTFTPRTYGPSA